MTLVDGRHDAHDFVIVPLVSGDDSWRDDRGNRDNGQ
jgi:hypothetical protein